MKYLKNIAFVLLLIGGLNWGVYGVSGYDLVNVLLGSIPMLANVVYVLVGLSALYIIIARFALCSCDCCCSKKGKESVKPEPVESLPTQSVPVEAAPVQSVPAQPVEENLIA